MVAPACFACSITVSTSSLLFIPSCVPCDIMEKPKKEGKKTCCGNQSHTSRSALSNRRSQTSHETGSTLVGSRTLGDHLPRLDEPAQSRRDRQRYGCECYHENEPLADPKVSHWSQESAILERQFERAEGKKGVSRGTSRRDSHLGVDPGEEPEGSGPPLWPRT